jgi:hypothetical protein
MSHSNNPPGFAFESMSEVKVLSTAWANLGGGGGGGGGGGHMGGPIRRVERREERKQATKTTDHPPLQRSEQFGNTLQSGEEREVRVLSGQQTVRKGDLRIYRRQQTVR